MVWAFHVDFGQTKPRSMQPTTELGGGETCGVFEALGEMLSAGRIDERVFQTLRGIIQHHPRISPLDMMRQIELRHTPRA